MANYSILPNLPKPVLTQMGIFLFLFFIAGLALINGWLGGVFHMTNGTILLICLFTILYSDNCRVFFLLAYALIISAFLDILTISFNWAYVFKYWAFYFGFAFAVFMIIVKIFLFIHQIQIAKQLNGEEPLPINLNKLFKSSTENSSSNTNQERHNQDLETGQSNRQRKNNSTENDVNTL